MIRELTYNNFRSFSHLSLNNLARFNLITGKNGSGKTSFLEGIFLICGGANCSLLLSLLSWRGATEYHPEVDANFRSYFHNYNRHQKIQLQGKRESEGKKKKSTREIDIEPILRAEQTATGSSTEPIIRGFQVTFRGPSGKPEVGKVEWRERTQTTEEVYGNRHAIAPRAMLHREIPEKKDVLNAHFLTPYFQETVRQVSDQIGALKKEKRLAELIDTLKCIEPRLIDIDTITEHNLQQIYVDIGLPSLVPLSSLGSGFFNFLRIGVGALMCRKGILLIDEIEDGIHFSIMPDLLKYLLNISRNGDTQLFVTTHSDEILSHLISVTQETNFEDYSVVRMQKTANKIEAVQFSAEELLASRDLKYEIR